MEDRSLAKASGRVNPAAPCRLELSTTGRPSEWDFWSGPLAAGQTHRRLLDPLYGPWRDGPYLLAVDAAVTAHDHDDRVEGLPAGRRCRGGERVTVEYLRAAAERIIARAAARQSSGTSAVETR